MELQKLEKLEVSGECEKGKGDEKPGTLKESELLVNTGKDSNPEYSVLQSSENIYATALNPSSTNGKELQRGIRMYRAMSIILFILTLILAAAVIALCTRLQTRTACVQEAIQQQKVQAEVCNVQLCKKLYLTPNSEKKDSGCHVCGHGWLQFENSCFYLSKLRETWNRSREQCRKWGADLAVIDNERVQAFLTEKGSLIYWIGLSRSSTGEWIWVNQTTVERSYWAPGADGEKCGILFGKHPTQNNWGSSPCTQYTGYICQKRA